MQQKCVHCKQFKELDNFKNTGKHCVGRKYFKLCADCRKRARSYILAYDRLRSGPKQKYNKRPAIYREPLEDYCNEYEVEPHIFYDPNNMVCFVKTDELFFVGDYHLSEFKFQTLVEAREFRDWAFGLFKAKT